MKRLLQFLALLILCGQAAAQNPPGNAQPTNAGVDGYKGVKWGTPLDTFLQDKNSDSNSSLAYNKNKNDFCSFNMSTKDKTPDNMKLMIIGNLFRDTTTTSAGGKYSVFNNDTGKMAELPLPEVFDSVWDKKEGVVYVFINKEFAGGFAVIDPKDIKATADYFTSLLDHNNMQMYPTQSWPLKKYKTTNTPAILYEGGYYSSQFPLSGNTFGYDIEVIKVVRKKHPGYLDTTQQQDYTGGIAYWDRKRYEDFTVALNKIEKDKTAEFEQLRAKHQNEGVNQLIKKNPNIQ